MKVNPKFLIMMAALVGGSALAAPTAPVAKSAGTTAGTVITNTATASYTNPADITKTLTADSNTVSTTVTPITGFDITYSDGSTDDTSASGTLPTDYLKANFKPGDPVFSTYTVLNNSNINGYVINIAPDTTGTSKTPTSVKYYPAGTTWENIGTTGFAEITSLTLANGEKKDFVQVITIPTGALPEETYSASPKGNAPASTDTTAYPATAPATATFAVYAESSNQNTTGTAATNGDLQYTRATVNKPVLNVLPPTGPNGTPPASPTDPTTPGPTPPPITPTPPLTYTPPVPTTPVPGTTTNPGTVIGITGDNQDAYPKADTDTAADVVTFFSKVENKSPLADTIYVKPTVPTGATSVKVLDKDGNVLTAEATGPNAGQFKLPGGPVAKDGTVEYRIVVVYPDSDSLATQADIAVPVDIYSGNVPTATPKRSTFTIHPPQMAFGDTTGMAPNTVPNATLSPVPTESVDPSSATTNTTKNTTGDRSAVFPMTVKNSGTYTEGFTLSAPNVSIVNRTGANSSVPVKYYSVLTGLLITETPVIAPGGVYDVLAVIDVPTTAAATDANNPEPVVRQTATGKFSGDSAEDIDDKIKIQSTGLVGVAKFVAKSGATAETVLRPSTTLGPVSITGNTGYTATGATTADPKTDITYQILAKNTYNSAVAKFFISDVVNTNVTFKSVKLVGVAAANTIYSNDGGVTWSATAPAATDTNIAVAMDADGAAPYLPAPLAADATLTAEFVVTVK